MSLDSLFHVWCNWACSVPASALGWPTKRSKVFIAGLDNAGKTTLIHVLKQGRFQPPLWASSGDFVVEGSRFTGVDYPASQPRYRQMLRDYLPDIGGIIYLVDAADPERFAETRHELERFLSWEYMPDIPFAIFGNKIDNPSAVSEEELRRELGLDGKTTGKEKWGPDWKRIGVRPLELFMGSVLERQGYQQAFQWLAEHV